jgi:hypothetical protein
MSETYFVCSKCGDKIEASDPNRDQWLIESAGFWQAGQFFTYTGLKAEMVIRCPVHITKYAEHKVGKRK